MTSAATATFAEAREALEQHWVTILSVSFALLVPLWIALFLVDVIGFAILPLISIGLYAYIKRAVDPNVSNRSILGYIRRHAAVAFLVTAIRAAIIGVFGYAAYQISLMLNLSIPGFEIGGAAVPIIDIQIPWLLLIGTVVMIPVSALPTVFMNVIAVSRDFGPVDSFKQNYRLWRGNVLGILLYITARFILIAAFISGVVGIWLTLESVTIAVLVAGLFAPVLFTLLSTYHYYYYTDIVMVV